MPPARKRKAKDPVPIPDSDANDTEKENDEKQKGNTSPPTTRTRSKAAATQSTSKPKKAVAPKPKPKKKPPPKIILKRKRAKLRTSDADLESEESDNEAEAQPSEQVARKKKPKPISSEDEEEVQRTEMARRVSQEEDSSGSGTDIEPSAAAGAAHSSKSVILEKRNNAKAKTPLQRKRSSEHEEEVQGTEMARRGSQEEDSSGSGTDIEPSHAAAAAHSSKSVIPEKWNNTKAKTPQRKRSSKEILEDAESGGTVPSPPAILNEDEDQEPPANQYVPVNVDLREEFLTSTRDEKELKQKIKLTDKEYRNKKVDLLRANLYTDLIRYFKKTPIDKMKHLMPAMSDKKFKRFITPNPILKNAKMLDKKRKIQKLVNYMCEKRDREVLYSASCRLVVTWIGGFEDKEWWTAFRLTKPRNTFPEDMTPLQFIEAVGTDFENQLKEIEAREFNDSLVETKTNTTYYVHCKLSKSKGICYVAVRIQQVAGKSRTKSKKGPALESSKTLIFAFKQNLPHLFVHGRAANPDERIMKIFTRCLQYKQYEPQQLSSKDLKRMIETCSRSLVMPDVEKFTKKFEEQEKIMNERGVFYVNRALEQQTQYKCSAIQDGQVAGVGTFTLQHKLKVPKTTEDEEQKFCPCQTSIKLAKGVKFDDCVAELYKIGAITDLHAFMKMKATKTNVYEESDEDEAEAES